MGLDIYLYKYENFAETQRKEKIYEEQSEETWNAIPNRNGRSYEELTEDEKNWASNKNKELAASLGLGDWGSDETTKHKVEKDSLKYPDHYFKVGYFRSSYNGGGIERVLSNLGVMGLHEIFQPNDEYCFQPNWNKALENVNKAIEELKTKPAYRVSEVSYNEFNGFPFKSDIKSSEDAMAQFLKEKGKGHGGSYSNGTGEYYLDEPIKVVGLIQGVKKRFFVKEFLPAVYVITESTNEWYQQALEIVKETIEYVLSQKDKELYYLHWSG